MQSNQNQITPLSNIETGRKVLIDTIQGSHNITRRLAAMGILPHAELEVVRNGHPGPFIVRVRGTRVALGRGVAHKIMVR
ncbi:MAG TPA: FeoA family protein [Sedimentisphaerales bacterium]|nr:FeoA family protein [Sedimentisphaerales bacterium]